MDTDEVGDENTVRLAGRVTGVAPVRVLPSGDAVQTVRVTVGRPPRRGEAGRAVVDAIDVACWTAATRRVAGRLGVGDRVQVEGALRRRFFRTGAGAASRYEVEAVRLRRTRAVTTARAASPP